MIVSSVVLPVIAFVTEHCPSRYWVATTVHFDNRGMSSEVLHGSWATMCGANCTGPACFKTQLEAVHYRQPPWSVRFPELVDVFEDHPCIPVNNDISDNTCKHCTFLLNTSSTTFNR